MLPKSEIVKQFGEPDFTYESADHGDLMNTDFVYNRDIWISYNDQANKVDSINIGDSVIYGKQGKRERALPLTH